jgi:adenylate cyclase
VKYTAHELSQQANIDLGLASRLWTAMGFPQPDESDAAYTDEDIEALRYAGELIQTHSVEPELLIQLTRTMASSIARIADAQLEVAVDRARRFGAEEGVLVDDKVVEMTPWLLGYMWRRHAAASFGRAMEAQSHEETSLAVGFADLVGFTALSQELPESDLASLVSRFDSDRSMPALAASSSAVYRAPPGSAAVASARSATSPSSRARAISSSLAPHALSRASASSRSEVMRRR